MHTGRHPLLAHLLILSVSGIHTLLFTTVDTHVVFVSEATSKKLQFNPICKTSHTNYMFPFECGVCQSRCTNFYRHRSYIVGIEVESIVLPTYFSDHKGILCSFKGTSLMTMKSNFVTTDVKKLQGLCPTE